MILGVGTDLTQISRIQRVLDRSGLRFVERVLSPDELARAPKDFSASWLAKRWAAKEAAAKALGCGIGTKAGFHDFVTGHTDQGAPTLTLTGLALTTSQARGHWHLSLSDDGDYAQAFVVWSD